MPISDFELAFHLDGKRYCLSGETITRNITDGSGEPIFSASVRCEDGRHGVCMLSADWKIVKMYMR